VRVVVIPHGALRRHLPARWECEADTAREALEGLLRQATLPEPAPGMKWRLRVLGYEHPIALASPLPPGAELHVVPDFSGEGPVAFIGLGVAMLAAGGAAYALGVGTMVVSLLVSTGLSLVLGGITQLLTPAPRADAPQAQATENPEESKYLGPAQNTTRAGTRIPIGYGRCRVFGHYLSFDVQADPEPVLGQAPRADQRRLMGVFRG
jgi:predicted phage tail protein